MSFTVEIPVPPSLNNAFFNRKAGGRVKTPTYRKWCRAAALTIVASVQAKDRVSGPFRISINLPSHIAGDIDNRVKGIVDALVASGRVDDDKNMEELHVRRRHVGEKVLVHVKPDRPDPASYQTDPKWAAELAEAA